MLYHRLVALAALSSVSIGLTSPQLRAADFKVEEQVVGPVLSNPPSLLVSRAGVSVATLTMKGSRSVVVIDGVEGPMVDQLLDTLGNPSLSCGNSVVFSPDGKSYAYAARVGDNFLVIRDGKEIYRGEFAHRAFQGGTGQLALSPRGKHLTFLEYVEVSANQHGWRLVVDGKPGPLSSNNNSFNLFFSPDDSRWAYVAAKLGGARDESFMVLDGKESPSIGHSIRFTGDNKVVIAAPAKDGTWDLHIDGKIAVKGVGNAESMVWVSAFGSRVAAALRKAPGVYALWIDGHEVPAAQGAKEITDVTFSPDGKHYIATCKTAAAQYAIVDGKKGLEYQLIYLPTFTRDSAHALYVASAGSKNFLVTDGVESDGFEMIGGQYVKIAMPQYGPRFAYTTADGMNRIFSLVADTKPVTLNNKAPFADSLAFSADGSHYALVAAPVGRSEINTLIVDGQEVPDMYPQTILQGAPNTAQREAFFIFSPDGKYIAQSGVRATTQKQGLYMNNKLVYPGGGISRAAFTPDSKHFVFAAPVPGKGTPVPGMAWFVDGGKAVEVPGYPLDQTGTWEMGSDGVYQFATVVGKEIKRFRITPSPDRNVDLMITQAEAAQAKALADEAAAKKKAEDDALAAKQKAEADKAAAAAKAKADYEAAQAKRKAAHDAAVAAKAKARQDAIDAKARARGR
jgi:WD40 repeat protein